MEHLSIAVLLSVVLDQAPVLRESDPHVVDAYENITGAIRSSGPQQVSLSLNRVCASLHNPPFCPDSVFVLQVLQAIKLMPTLPFDRPAAPLAHAMKCIEELCRRWKVGPGFMGYIQVSSARSLRRQMLTEIAPVALQEKALQEKARQENAQDLAPMGDEVRGYCQ